VKLDAFCHIMPKPYFDRLQEISTERAANLLRRTAPIKHLWDLDTRFELMDRYDDYAQIISLAAPPIEALGDRGLSAELATLANDELASLVSSHPALNAVSPQAPQADWFLGDDVHHHGAFLLASAEIE